MRRPWSSASCACAPAPRSTLTAPIAVKNVRDTQPENPVPVK